MGWIRQPNPFGIWSAAVCAASMGCVSLCRAKNQKATPWDVALIGDVLVRLAQTVCPDRKRPRGMLCIVSAPSFVTRIISPT